ncbi:hypothetical protein V6N11_079406 [Hibiscus sabdariffa]|uniref:t-SNARE coiled-coil homology domain-containing protein n=1 Tax=Hibiscus sabdariffa TaxID=183260 RepID=A0ABR2RW02_9ROSI
MNKFAIVPGAADYSYTKGDECLWKLKWHCIQLRASSGGAPVIGMASTSLLHSKRSYAALCTGGSWKLEGTIIDRIDYNIQNVATTVEEGLKQLHKLEISPVMVASVWTDDRNLQLEAATEFRNLLSGGEAIFLGRSRPIDEVLQVGVVPRFVEFLTRDDFPQIQHVVACSLSHIAGGTSENTKVLIDHGAVMASGNIALDSHRNRDLVLSHGALLPLSALLNEQTSFSLVQSGSWTLSNLCSDMPVPSLIKFDLTSAVRPALPTLARLIHSDDEEASSNACQTLCWLSYSAYDKTQAVIEAGVCGRLVELLLHPSASVLTSALGTIAIFSMYIVLTSTTP